MSSLWNAMTGEPDEYSSRKRSARSSVAKASSEPRPKREHRPESKSPERPEGVSEAVWGLAQQWIEIGTGALQRRPMVNLENFSTRLAERINNDPELVGYRSEVTGRVIPGFIQLHGQESLNDLLVRMTQMFWDWAKEEKVPNSTSIQFAFLEEDSWNNLIYNAQVSLEVQTLRKRMADGTARTVDGLAYIASLGDGPEIVEEKRKARQEAFDAEDAQQHGTAEFDVEDDDTGEEVDRSAEISGMLLSRLRNATSRND